jgi:hypothetical protein
MIWEGSVAFGTKQELAECIVSHGLTSIEVEGATVVGARSEQHGIYKISGPEGKFILRLNSKIIDVCFSDTAEKREFATLLTVGKLKLYAVLEVLLSRHWESDRVAHMEQVARSYGDWLKSCDTLRHDEGGYLPGDYGGNVGAKLCNQAVHNLVLHIPTIARYLWGFQRWGW